VEQKLLAIYSLFHVFHVFHLFLISKNILKIKYNGFFRSENVEHVEHGGGSTEAHLTARTSSPRHGGSILGATILKPCYNGFTTVGRSTMTAISKEEYQEIRRKFMQNRARKLEARAAELLAEPGAKSVATADELTDFAGSPPPTEDRPASLEGNDKPA
jgi:hypothetical protein